MHEAVAEIHLDAAVFQVSLGVEASNLDYSIVLAALDLPDLETGDSVPLEVSSFSALTKELLSDLKPR